MSIIPIKTPTTSGVDCFDPYLNVLLNLPSSPLGIDPMPERIVIYQRRRGKERGRQMTRGKKKIKLKIVML